MLKIRKIPCGSDTWFEWSSCTTRSEKAQNGIFRGGECWSSGCRRRQGEFSASRSKSSQGNIFFGCSKRRFCATSAIERNERFPFGEQKTDAIQAFESTSSSALLFPLNFYKRFIFLKNQRIPKISCFFTFWCWFDRNTFLSTFSSIDSFTFQFRILYFHRGQKFRCHLNSRNCSSGR